jgi:hypothetical protein
VANIKSLDEILSWLFFILSVYWIQQYLLTNRSRWLVIAAVSYFISLLSKESAITFIAIVPLLLYFFYAEKKSSILKITGVMAIPAILFLVIRLMIFRGTTPALPPEADNMLLLAASDITYAKGNSHFSVRKLYQACSYSRIRYCMIILCSSYH